MSTANFTRLKDGSWGVRVNTETRPEAGDRILISKKDGSIVNAIIDEVQWFGTARDGRKAALVSIVKEPRRRQSYTYGYDDDREEMEAESRFS